MVALYFNYIFFEPVLEVMSIPVTLFVINHGWFSAQFSLFGMVVVVILFGLLGLFIGAGINFFLKKNRDFITSVILLFGIIFSIIIYIIVLDMKPQKCYFMVNNNEKDKCFMYSVNYTSAQRLKNDFCEKISAENIKKECYFSLATEKYNLQLCNKASSRDTCIDKVIEGLANKNHNYDKCQEIKKQDIRKDCFFSKALFLKNPNVCLELDDKSETKRCCEFISQRTGKVVSCDKLIGQNITTIFEDNASKQSEKCAAMHDRSSKDNCYYKVAEFVSSYKSFNFCEKITYQNMKRKCYEDFVYPNIKHVSDINVCEEMQNAQEASIFCFNNLAVNTANPEICLKIKTIPHRGTCYNNVAMATKNDTICEKHENTRDKDGCYLVVSMTMGTQICDKINDVDIRKKCKSGH